MGDVTQLLNALDCGDAAAADQLLPLVYDALRILAAQRLAQERPGQTLDATALVHEAYMRLVKEPDGQGRATWNGRGHFFAAAAEAMRRILLNRARDKARFKRGGGRRRVDLDGLAVPDAAPADDLIELDDALTALEQAYPRCAQLVKLRFFAGLSQGKAAEALGVSRRTADREWAFARAWLLDALGGGEENRGRDGATGDGTGH